MVQKYIYKVKKMGYDKRISELPAAGSLDGTELFAVVQGGVTKYTTSQNINYVTSNNYGLFNQTGSSVPISGSVVEENLIGGGVGTLSVPANGFKQGDAFHAILTGLCTFHNGEELDIRVKSDNVTLAETGTLTLANATNKRWKLEMFFSINQIGETGTAEIVSSGTFMYSEDQAGKFNGTNFSFINSSSFDTTIDNTLVITSQFNDTNCVIQSKIFTLTKTF